MRYLGFVVLALLGCGEGPPAGPTDAGDVDAGAPFVPSTPAPPEPPAAPALPALACPYGWRSVPDPDVGDLATCEPWPEDGPLDCGIDEAHFPGRPGCERIGPACPAGDFADGLPGSGVRYVRTGEGPGGDGSIALPFGTIAEGIAAAADGDVVALSKGTFDEVVVVDRPIVLWGACVAETVLASSTPSVTDATLGIARGGAVVKNLRVSGARFGATVGEDPEAVTFESVVISGATGVGLIVRRGGLLLATDLVVRDVAPADGLYGYGIEVLGGARFEGERIAVERTSTLGILAFDAGSAIVLGDAVVRDVAPSPADDSSGVGIEVREGTSVEATRIVVERTRTAAIDVWADAAAILSDGVLRDAREQASDSAEGIGLKVAAGGRAELHRALVSRAASAGIWIVDGDLAMSDVVVADTEGVPPPGFGGLGASIDWRSSAVLERVAFVRNRAIALRAYEGSDVHASDVTVVDTRAAPDTRTGGIGAAALDGAHLEIDRAVIERSRLAGVFADGSLADLVGRDVAVRDMLAQESDGQWGMGVQVTRDARVDLTRVAVERARDMAFAVGAELVATDVAITDTREGGTGWGIGIYVGTPGSARVTRARIERSRVSGVLVSGTEAPGAPATATFEDLVVTDSLESSCVSADCTGGGRGLTASADGVLSATRFLVTASALCGVQLVRGGTIDLADGEVSGNPIGANVQTEDFDYDRIRVGVLYRDNDQDLDATALPVPEARPLP